MASSLKPDPTSTTEGKTESEDENNIPSSAESEDAGTVFFPPLYIQRYNYVKEIMSKHNLKSLVDFGSAECKIGRFLVQIPSLERLTLVDLDRDLLEANKSLIRPLILDYIVRRKVELEVKLLQGNVVELDSSVVGTEAVSMVEIIEHLYEDVLSGAVQMVFGWLQPRLVVMTTPNADYNQLFPNFSGFRHWDHKFEWTRHEFREWCDAICGRYDYSVEYGGVGEPPPGSEHLGHCSQSAIFHRQGPCTRSVDHHVTHNYQLIASSTYPVDVVSTFSAEDQALLEINYRIRQYRVGNQLGDIECSCSYKAGNQEDNACDNCRCAGYQTEENESLVPVSHLLKFKEICGTFQPESFRTFLQKHGYKMTSDQEFLVIPDDIDDDVADDDDEQNVNSLDPTIKHDSEQRANIHKCDGANFHADETDFNRERANIRTDAIDFNSEPVSIGTDTVRGTDCKLKETKVKNVCHSSVDNAKNGIQQMMTVKNVSHSSVDTEESVTQLTLAMKNVSHSLVDTEENIAQITSTVKNVFHGSASGEPIEIHDESKPVVYGFEKLGVSELGKVNCEKVGKDNCEKEGAPPYFCSSGGGFQIIATECWD